MRSAALLVKTFLLIRISAHFSPAARQSGFTRRQTPASCIT
jgi:hypothetical protein